MADDKTKTGSFDRNHISLKEDYEVRDWCEALACTGGQLREAVSVVGNRAENVRDYLRLKK